MSRLARRLLPVALSLVLWATSPDVARASYLFSGPPAQAGVITMFANGNMAGAVPVGQLSPIRDDSGAAHIIVGTLTFNPGRSLAGTPTAGYDLVFGGSFSILGSLDGGPMGTLLDCSKLLSGGHVDYLGAVPGGAAGAGRYHLEVGFWGDLSPVAAAAIHVKPGLVNGVFVVEFSGVPGGPMDAGAVGGVRFDAATSAPEPASVGMVGVGLAAAWWVAGRRRAITQGR